MFNEKYSIIMTTYNGEKYVINQLESIRQQTLVPTEVLIFDDCSTDRTQIIILDYIHQNNLNWELICNKKNLGWKKNFIQGICKAKYEYIFISDQDDIWEPNKCEFMIYTMVGIASCNLLLSNYEPFSLDKSIHIPFSMRFQKQTNHFTKIEPNVINITSVFRPGCTYCFRKTFYDVISKYWIDNLAHDQFIFHMALLFDSAYHIEFKSIKFRRHDQNNTPPNIRDTQFRILQIEESLKHLNMYSSFVKLQFGDNYFLVPILERALEFLYCRKNYYSLPSLKKWIHLFYHYYNCYPSARNLAGDFYIGIVRSKNYSQ